MKIADKVLFSRLAYSCINKMISRKLITSDQTRSIYESLMESEDVSETLRKYFPLSEIMLEKTAKRMKKDCIDQEVMISYFTSDEHQKVIEASYSKYGDFDKDDCLARIGKVGGIAGNYAVVKASQPHVYLNTFRLDLKSGDNVLVHGGSVITKI